MMKKFLSIILAAAMIMSLAACGNSVQNDTPASTEEIPVEDTVAVEDTEAAQTEAESEAQTEAEEVSCYPVTVVDQAGREVVIENEPEKLVSGYYISTSLLIALGLEDKMVGIEAKADKRPIYKLSAPELIDLPNVGSAKEFDLEGCAALEPDLIILPLKLKEAAAALEELGFKVVLVNPENQELLIQMTEMIAEATNTQARAEELMAFINNKEQELTDSLKDTEPVSVYLAGNSDLLSTAGNGMYQSDMMSIAGGINVAQDIDDTYWVESSYEQIIDWNPDYIILASDAGYTVEDVMNDENLSVCTAVVNGNVYQIPSNAEAWDSPVPGGVLGSVWLASVLHPEVVTEDECYEVVEEFYETFYDFSYSE